MDQALLVANGHILVEAMDQAGFGPQLAMWVHATDTDTWKLWVVPPYDVTDKNEFYRRVAEVISKRRSSLGDFSASDVEMQPATHPAVQGIGSFMRMPGLGSAHFSGNRFNGFYLPDGVILRSDLQPPPSKSKK